jgi:Calcineurin-like phosphoesterase superfamily domain
MTSTRTCPALDAVLHEVHDARVDQIVIGGDVVPGPMQRETLARLSELDVPVHFISSNGELGLLAQVNAADPNDVIYCGTTSGAILPEPLRELVRWAAKQLRPEDEQLLASWPMTLRLHIPEIGDVLFCHATPHSETDAFMRLTPEECLLPVFEGVNVPLVVCGHTHLPFDRMIGKTRVINARSVGMPFGTPGADWLLLGPEIQLRHTSYNLLQVAAKVS